MLLYLTYAVGKPHEYEVWRSHLISRAAENQRFVLAVNTAADDVNCPTAIIHPSGRVLAETRGSGSPLAVTVDVTEVSNWYLSQARTDLLPFTGPGEPPNTVEEGA